MPRITTHLRTNVVGYVALFLALSAGAYAAGLAPNSVKSEHIVNGEVRNAELRADAVTGPKVAASSLTGADLGPNSLGGQEIAENTLGEVPNATIAGHGGYGRQSSGPEFGSDCDPSDDLFITCASVTLYPSAPARFFVTARFRVQTAGQDEGDWGWGVCRLGDSALGGIPGTSARMYTVSPEDTFWGSDFVTLTGITYAHNPGSRTFGLDCKEEVGDLQIRGARVTAIAISPF